MLITTQCAVGIGSNIEPSKHIPIAINRLQDEFGNLKLSSAYASKAVLFVGNDFINIVALLSTSLHIVAFSQKIKAIEQKIDPSSHRLKNRKIDLDVLLYGQEVMPQHNIPHKDILKFSFTACPLAELLPAGLHPENGTSYQQLCKMLENSPKLTRLNEF